MPEAAKAVCQPAISVAVWDFVLGRYSAESLAQMTARVPVGSADPVRDSAAQVLSAIEAEDPELFGRLEFHAELKHQRSALVMGLLRQLRSDRLMCRSSQPHLERVFA